MYDLLRNTILLELFSRQFTEDFQVSTVRKIPQPKMFVASANQFIDNAATQARCLSMLPYTDEYNKVFYPVFSPKWCFSFEGGLANKGATKVFQEKHDMELIL
jgi:hypothetical protein